jgi:hypothetical protein
LLSSIPLTALALAALAHPRADSAFPPEQLEQIVAPVALYPDALLAQVLMAATYPLEIVEAHRWVQQNAKLSGQALEAALMQQEWDPSVEALCGFGSVLKKMNDNLHWTQDLGDALLAQEAELLAAVQRMRAKAVADGSLESTQQQTVTQEDEIIVIESTSTEVVYVPVYSPVVVYGDWTYPSWYYPTLYQQPPPGYGAAAFTAGVVWGAAVWGDCDWHHGDVYVDVDRYNEFNRNTNVHAEQVELARSPENRAQWTHAPEHRKGVNYGDARTARSYAEAPSSSHVTRDRARGYERAATTQAAGRPSTTAARDTGARPATQRPESERATERTTASSSSAHTSRSSAYSGSRNPGFDRSASSRGASSRSGGVSHGGGRRGR